VNGTFSGGRPTRPGGESPPLELAPRKLSEGGERRFCKKHQGPPTDRGPRRRRHVAAKSGFLGFHFPELDVCRSFPTLMAFLHEPAAAQRLETVVATTKPTRSPLGAPAVKAGSRDTG